MNVSVWDTYIQRIDGKIMHFDILVPSDLTNKETIFGFGKTYLKSKPFEVENLTSKECQFCHIEQVSDAIKSTIQNRGFYIIEMENCN